MKTAIVALCLTLLGALRAHAQVNPWVCDTYSRPVVQADGSVTAGVTEGRYCHRLPSIADPHFRVAYTKTGTASTTACVRFDCAAGLLQYCDDQDTNCTTLSPPVPQTVGENLLKSFCTWSTQQAQARQQAAAKAAVQEVQRKCGSFFPPGMSAQDALDCMAKPSCSSGYGHDKQERALDCIIGKTPTPVRHAVKPATDNHI